MSIAKAVMGIIALGSLTGAGCAKDAPPPAAEAASAAEMGGAPAAAEAADPSAAQAGPALPDKVGAIEIGALAALLADQPAKVHVFDANGDKTRGELGYIPGATLLADYQHCADELPDTKDAKLVFYCYNEMCGASHKAAEQAVLAGYSDVNVLPAGIVGWKQAGQEVASL